MDENAHSPNHTGRGRFWLKKRLPDDERGRRVRQIVEEKWRGQAPRRLIEAILLYDALHGGEAHHAELPAQAVITIESTTCPHCGEQAQTIHTKYRGAAK
jgi:hypothetical protein